MVGSMGAEPMLARFPHAAVIILEALDTRVHVTLHLEGRVLVAVGVAIASQANAALLIAGQVLRIATAVFARATQLLAAISLGVAPIVSPSETLSVPTALHTAPELRIAE